MLKALFIIVGLALSTSAIADKYVRGYVKKDGTYVQGHMRSSPDSYRFNNLNSQSNRGSQRDEFSNYGATNKSNSSYGVYDNDNDGITNSIDINPESANKW